MASASVTEEEVGICEFVSTHPGFTAILKHRFRDFQVNEVDSNGRVAVLQTLVPPPQEVLEEPIDVQQLSDDVIADVAMKFSAAAGPANGEKLRELLEAIQKLTQPPPDALAASGTGNPAGDVQSVPLCTADTVMGSTATSAVLRKEDSLSVVLDSVASKDERRAIHGFFRGNASLPVLDTTTADISKGVAGQNIQVVYRMEAASSSGKRKRGEEGGGRGGRGRGGRDGRGGGRGGVIRHEARWSGGANKFTKFVLWKENMDTMVSMNLIARTLGLSNQALSFAGTKDKRGVTTQYVTAFKVEPAQLAGLNSKLRGICLGNFEFASEGLHLGALSGNRFRLIMRNVSGAPDVEAMVNEVCRTISETGFINYFGLQRFGTGGTRTHKVGAALLRGEYEGAVRMLMTGRSDEKADVASARSMFLDKGDAKGALRFLPHWATAERAMLAVLERQAGGYAAALQAIPRNLRLMYLHAFQSYVWNAAASHRIRTYGASQVVEGDLVIPFQSSVASTSSCADLVSEDGAVLEGGSSEEGGGSRRLTLVHLVTAEDVASGKYSIQDVVLPLLGCKVKYPEHGTAEVYRDLANQDGVLLEGLRPKDDQPGKCSVAAAAAAASTDDVAAATPVAVAAPAASTVRQVKEFSFSSLPGDYRHVVHRPADFEWKLVKYCDPNDDSLVSTDMELLKMRQQLTDLSAEPGPPPTAADFSSEPRPPSSAADLSAEAGPPPIAADLSAEAGPVSTAADLSAEPGPLLSAADLSVKPGPPPAVETTGSTVPLPPPPPTPSILLALQLSFQLPSSTYATMLIRELTKASTSKDFQSSLAHD